MNFLKREDHNFKRNTGTVSVYLQFIKAEMCNIRVYPYFFRRKAYFFRGNTRFFRGNA